eukprot:898830-Prymnesium_polylepis.1
MSNSHVDNCEAAGWSAYWAGGGLYIWEGTVNLASCTIRDNTIHSADAGSGIFIGCRSPCSYPTVTIRGSTISNNAGGTGTGIYCTGTGTSLEIDGTTISDSLVQHGGASVCTWGIDISGIAATGTISSCPAPPPPSLPSPPPPLPS